MITLRHVNKTFFPGSPQEMRAVRDISLQVPSGQWVALIGSNGAGKSTLLKLIAGTVRPDNGQVLIDDVDVTYTHDYRRARMIGRLDQDPLASTAPTLSIQQNLAMALQRGQRRGLKRAVSRDRRVVIGEGLARLGMGLENRLGAPVGTLSGGQRQALGMIMATIARPKALLLDEHVAALDPRAAASVMTITQDLIAENQLTTVMVTHNMQFALDYGDRLIAMHDGKIVVDLIGEEKAAMTVPKLLDLFHQLGADGVLSDRALL